MSNPTAVATAVLLSCLFLIGILGRAKVFGTVAVTGFVLGSLATASLFVLLG